MINSQKKNALLGIMLMLISSIGFAQEEESVEVRDFETWSSIGLRYKLNKKWSFGLEEQLRLKNNSSEVDTYFTQFNVQHELFDNFELGLGLRYIRKNDNVGNKQGYENHFRYNLDAIYKQKIESFSLKYRLRYQNKNELGITASEGDEAKQYLRFKTSITYNIKNWKLDPKFSAEVFNQVENDQDNGFNKYRLNFGTNYKIKKVGKLGVFYRIEKELNVDYPKSTHILGLKFTHTLKKK